MSELILETPEGVRLRYEIAGAGSRAAAALVDLTLFAVGFLSIAFLALLAALADPTGVSQFALGLLAGGAVLFLGLYAIVLGVLTRGSSPGKRLLGIRVADARGDPASPLQHVLRGFFLPFEALLFVPVSLGLVLIAATERRQRLGDLVAGTLVLREPGRGASPEPLPGKRRADLPRRALELSPAVAARFGPGDRALLRELLSRPTIDPDARARLARGALEAFAPRLGLDPAALERGSALELASELYLYLREGASSGYSRPRSRPR